MILHSFFSVLLLFLFMVLHYAHDCSCTYMYTGTVYGIEVTHAVMQFVMMYMYIMSGPMIITSQ